VKLIFSDYHGNSKKLDNDTDLWSTAKINGYVKTVCVRMWNISLISQTGKLSLAYCIQWISSKSCYSSRSVLLQRAPLQQSKCVLYACDVSHVGHCSPHDEWMCAQCVGEHCIPYARSRYYRDV